MPDRQKNARAEQVYQEKLKDTLEKTHPGFFVAIEPDFYLAPVC